MANGESFPLEPHKCPFKIVRSLGGTESVKRNSKRGTLGAVDGITMSFVELAEGARGLLEGRKG